MTLRRNEPSIVCPTVCGYQLSLLNGENTCRQESLGYSSITNVDFQPIPANVCVRDPIKQFSPSATSLSPRRCLYPRPFGRLYKPCRSPRQTCIIFFPAEDDGLVCLALQPTTSTSWNCRNNCFMAMRTARETPYKWSVISTPVFAPTNPRVIVA